MSDRDEALSEEGRARRRFLKRAGTVAWASPLILTMMSRAAHATHGAHCGFWDGDGCFVLEPCGSAHQCVRDVGPFNNGLCICIS